MRAETHNTDRMMQKYESTKFDQHCLCVYMKREEGYGQLFKKINTRILQNNLGNANLENNKVGTEILEIIETLVSPCKKTMWYCIFTIQVGTVGTL